MKTKTGFGISDITAESLPPAAINAVKRIKRDKLNTVGAPINFLIFFPKWLEDSINEQLDSLENRIKEIS